MQYPRSLPEDLQLLERSLPERFAFYHLGEIAADRGPGTIPSDLPSELNDPAALSTYSALGIRFQGDLRALFLVLVEEGLDLSIYSEVANILASRLATSLSEGDGAEIVISAPSTVSPQRLKSILLNPSENRTTLVRKYLHRYGSQMIPIHAVLLLDLAEGGEARA